MADNQKHKKDQFENELETLKQLVIKNKLVLENANDLIAVHRLNDLSYEYINPATLGVLGYSEEDLLGKSVIEFIHPDDIEKVMKTIKEDLEQGEGSAEFRYRKKDGSYIWLESTAKLIPNRNNNLTMVVISRDITDRKKVEEELRLSELRYRMVLQKKETELRRIIENVNDLISKVDNSGVFTYVSPRIYDLLGYTPEEFMGKSVFDFMTDIEAERVGLIFQEIVSKKEPYNLIENTLIHKDGFPVVFESSGTPIFDEQEILQGYTNICRDITKRKMAEEALHQKTEELDRFFNLTLDMLCIADTDGYFKKVNSAWERYLGYSSEELLSKPFTELIHPDDITSTLCAISKLESQMEVVDFVNRYRHKDGTYRWIEWRSAPSGKLIYAAARDITERKYAEEKLQKAYDELEMRVQERTAQLNKINEELQNEIMVRKGVEESLRESENYYRTIFENTGTVTLIVNKDHKISRINSMFERLLGYSKNDLEGKEFTAFVIPEYVDLMMANHRLRELDPVSAPQGYEIKGYSKEGEIRDFICGVSVIPESQNSIVSLLDITEQREAEKAIKHTIEFQELLLKISRKFTSIVDDDIDEMINTTLQLIGEFDDDDRSYVFLFSDYKSTMDNTHEWCAEGIQPEIDNLKDLPSDIFPWWMEKLQRFETINIPSVADLPSEVQAEKEILKSQDIQSVLVVPIAYSNNLIGFLGFDSVKKSKMWSEESTTLLALVAQIFANALQRRKYIMAIRESEIYYRTVFENTGTAMLLLDKDFQITMANSEAEKLTDCTREELIGKTPLSWVAPECIEKVQENIRLRKLDPVKAPKEYEIKCIDKQGNLRNVVLNVSFVPDNENLIISLRDITDLKRAENDIINRIKARDLVLDIFFQSKHYLNDNIFEIISTTLQYIGEFTSDDHSYIILFSDDRSTINNTYEWCAEGVQPIIHDLQNLMAKFIPWSIERIKRFEYIYIPDVKNVNLKILIEKEFIQSLSICSLLLVPIAREDKLIGFLGVDTVKQLKKWQEDDIAFIKFVGEYLASIIQHHKDKEALKKSDDYYRTVFENTGAATAILEEDLTIFMINEKFERLLGYSKEQILNKKTYFDLVADEDQEIVREIYQLRNTQPELAPREYEISIVNIFGDVINVILTADLIPGTTKRAVSIVDITKQKQMLKMLEDRLADLNRLLIRISNI